MMWFIIIWVICFIGTLLVRYRALYEIYKQEALDRNRNSFKIDFGFETIGCATSGESGFVAVLFYLFLIICPPLTLTIQVVYYIVRRIMTLQIWNKEYQIMRRGDR